MRNNHLIEFKDKFQKFIKNLNKNNCKYTIGSFINPITNYNKHTFLSEISSIFDKYFFWEIPEKNYSILGFDELINISSNGSARFIETSEKIESIRDSIYSNYTDFPDITIPFVLGGLKFSVNDQTEEWNGYKDSEWFIPKYLFINQNNESYILINWHIDEKSDPLLLLNSIEDIFDIVPDEPALKNIKAQNVSDERFEKQNWIDNINNAISQIENQHFSKIVVSRKKDVQLSSHPDISVLIEKLAENNPSCYIFAYGSDENVFWGASPEKLVKYNGSYIEADALAGSIARGKNPEEDEMLENELLTSEKNLAEQKSVVDFIVSTFSNFSNKIESPAYPVIKKFGNIQHLYTPISAEVDPDFNIFELISSIHPTPAICGAPCTIAHNVINELENYKRGLYSGVIGWLNFEQQGEFAVGIRSALLNDKKLVVFAGCGIVKGSDPEMEFNEAELKMVPILSLFDYDNSN